MGEGKKTERNKKDDDYFGVLCAVSTHAGIDVQSYIAQKLTFRVSCSCRNVAKLAATTVPFSISTSMALSEPPCR